MKTLTQVENEIHYALLTKTEMEEIFGCLERLRHNRVFKKISGSTMQEETERFDTGLSTALVKLKSYLKDLESERLELRNLEGSFEVQIHN